MCFFLVCIFFFFFPFGEFFPLVFLCSKTFFFHLFFVINVQNTSVRPPHTHTFACWCCVFVFGRERLLEETTTNEKKKKE